MNGKICFNKTKTRMLIWRFGFWPSAFDELFVTILGPANFSERAFTVKRLNEFRLILILIAIQCRAERFAQNFIYRFHSQQTRRILWTVEGKGWKDSLVLKKNRDRNIYCNLQFVKHFIATNGVFMMNCRNFYFHPGIKNSNQCLLVRWFYLMKGLSLRTAKQLNLRGLK